MWTDIATGITRAIAPAIIAWIVAKWGLPEEAATQLWGYASGAIVAVVTLVAAVWSVRSNLRKSREITDLRKELRTAASRYP